MKIKTARMDYDKVLKLERKKHKRPIRPNLFWRTLVQILSLFALIPLNFKFEKKGMDRLGKKEPCLILMNHSCFNDFEIASRLLYPRAYNVVATTDGFVGKGWLMRQIGCIPTQKFVTDVSLIRDITHSIRKLRTSVLMYPEAGYSFDGTATTLPESLGGLIKMLKVPLIVIKTKGAFLRNPLYNNLQVRRVDVSAEMEYVLSPEQISAMSADEINGVLREQFTFDGFRWQQEHRIRIAEDFRADSLNRVLYKCPHCNTEGETVGKGTRLVCNHCRKEYELDEYGFMRAIEGETEFSHIPDWFAWERQCVRDEILDGSYSLDVEVDICMMVDTSCLYAVGEGRLTHSTDGFRLVGCDGRLDYSQKPLASYSLNADYYWYEIGDVICIGNTDALYYCFPKNCGDIVAKTRLAAEEMYKLAVQKKLNK